jgi:HEAT repeat protein
MPIVIGVLLLFFSAGQVCAKQGSSNVFSSTTAVIRRDATIKLGTERKKENVPRLIRMLDDRDIDVQRAAVRSLAKVKDERAVDPMIKKYGEEDDAGVRLDIIIAMREFDSDKSVAFLRDRLKEKYPAYKTTALKSLVHIGRPDVREDIVKMLGDTSESAKMEATKLVERYGINTPQVRRQLIANLDIETPLLQRVTAKALGKVGNMDAIKPLKKVSKSKDKRVKKEAKKAINMIREKFEEK